MKKSSQTLFAIITVCYFLTSCASSYKKISTSTQNYVNRQVIDGYLDIGYSYDIYSSTLNKKYSKKEDNYHYRAIAVEITNISEIPIVITNENFKIYVGDHLISTENIDTYLMNVKQLAGIYLLHGFWGPWSIQRWSDSQGNSGGKVIYLPIGLTIGVINAIVAGSANKKHAENIKEQYIFNKTMEPNEKITGIICLKYDRYDQLTFKYLE